MTMLELGLLAVVLFGVGKASVGFLYKKDEAREDRRRGAAQMAMKLSELGLKRVPEFLIDYSVGDYSAMGAKVKNVASTFLNGENAVIDEFGQIFENVLGAKLKSETGRAYIAAKLQDALKPEDVTIAKDAPVPMLQQPISAR